MSLTYKFENAVMYNYYQGFEHMIKKSKTTPQVMPCHGQIQLSVDRVAGDLFNQARWFFSAKKIKSNLVVHGIAKYTYIDTFVCVCIYIMNLIGSR